MKKKLYNGVLNQSINEALILAIERNDIERVKLFGRIAICINEKTKNAAQAAGAAYFLHIKEKPMCGTTSE
ncbi:hypothetical protein HAP94_06205 [Acidithiobacillus ferrivorans]|nr:hypothetical protein [Acidithiobacillus ferrivorans]